MKFLTKSFKNVLLCSCVFSALSAGAHATVVKVEVSNLFGDGGLALTPVWAGFHDGTFDSFDLGSEASANLQALAEGGDVSGIRSDFESQSNGVDGVIFAPEGFAGAPVFEPGESSYAMFDIDATNNGYFSFLSMLIPTNDAFIGNDAPDAYSLFDTMGKFVGLDIIILGSQVWDSGTEANIGYGAPFLVGADGQPRQDENGVVGVHQGLGVPDDGFSIIGGLTPAGYMIDQNAADFTAAGFQVARITISEVNSVSAPAFGAFSALVLGAFVARRRLQNK